MVAQVQQVFSFLGGINTEASLVQWPEQFSVDEQNYELLIDGSRRRRKGLAIDPETDPGSPPEFISDVISWATDKFYWEAPGNDANLRLICVQTGPELQILPDEAGFWDSYLLSIDLITFAAPDATLEQIKTSPIDISFPKGDAVVVGKYIEPFLITYNSADGTFRTTKIDIQKRDYEGIEDGVSLSALPSTLSETHRYNLYNRGWLDANIASFQTDQSLYPAKNMIQGLGYRGTTTANVAEADWTKEFSSDKLVAELFQEVSAPQGHIKVNVFDTKHITVPGYTTSFPITNWALSNPASGNRIITFTTASAHGLSAGDQVTITGNSNVFYSSEDGTGYDTIPLNSVQTVASSATATTFTIVIVMQDGFSSWTDQFESYGTVNTNYFDNSLRGYETAFRFEVTAAWAGRAWYIGCSDSHLASTVFFSQIIEQPGQYGKCYTNADPTDLNVPDPVDSDGGYIYIPGLVGAKKAVVYGNALLIFSTTGVWQISPGQNGVFSPTSYNVRRITDLGMLSRHSLVMAEGTPYYCGMDNIFRVMQDPKEGFLFVENLSEVKIHTLYNSIAYNHRGVIQGSYDPVLKKIWWLYNVDDNTTYGLYSYRRALIFDTRLQAFYRHVFALDDPSGSKYIRLLVPVTLELDDEQRLVFIASTDVYATTNACLLSDISFQDVGSDIDTYVISGYSLFEAPTQKKGADYIWVYSKKTETGFENVSGDLVPIRESSTLMQARWDWSDRSSAGKWGNPQQVYRHLRQYTPVDDTDTFDDGVPVLVTKNTIRGRGRSLHLKFSCEAGKDSHLVGWATLINIKAGK